MQEQENSFKNNISNYNITNLDTKIFILILEKYFFSFKLKKKLKINSSIYLILKLKQIINKLNYKKYND